MGVTGMGLDRYKQGFNRYPIISSTLDHRVLKTPENCTQEDGYNCGVFTLLMMMMGSKGEIQQRQRTYTRDDLIWCCLQLFKDIIKVAVPQTKFSYNWEEHRVDNNPRRWRQIVVNSIAKGYDHKKDGIE